MTQYLYSFSDVSRSVDFLSLDTFGELKFDSSLRTDYSNFLVTFTFQLLKIRISNPYSVVLQHQSKIISR